MPADPDTEQLIRDALRLQAGRAPHPAAIEEALRRGDRAVHRGRTTALVLTAAVVALAAVGIPVGLHLTARPAAAQVSTRPGPPTPTPNPAVAGTVLRYRAGWLPAGFVEDIRSIGSQGGQIRGWAPPGADPVDPAVSIRLTSTPPTGTWQDTAGIIAASTGRTTVHGAPGMVSLVTGGTAPRARVIWMPSPDVVLDVDVTGRADGVDIARKVADSVVPDGRSTVTDPLTVGHPAGSVDGFEVRGVSPTDWEVLDGATSATDGVLVTYRTSPPPAGGIPVTVRGITGSYLAGTQVREGTGAQPVVSVPLDGHWLLVTMSGASEKELLSVADSVTVVPLPDPAWIGSR